MPRLDYATPQTPKPTNIPRPVLIAIAASFIVIALAEFYSRGYTPQILIPLLLNGALLLLWLLCAFGLGLWIVRAMRIECAAILRGTISIAMGLGVLSLLILGLGCAGILNRWTAIAIVAAGAIAAAGPLLKSRRVLSAQIVNASPLTTFLVVLLPLFVIVVLCSMLPPGLLWRDEPNGYDVTEYHLQVPREWCEAGRIVPLQHNVFSYFPFNVEMHYLLAMHLCGGPWKGMYLAQLMHASFIVLTLLSIYALLVERYPRGAIVGAVIAAGVPWLALLAPMAYNEGGLLLFGTLAIGLALRGLRESKATKWMLLAGAMAGFACGSKLTAGPMILAPLPIIVALARFAFPLLSPAEGRGEGASISNLKSEMSDETPLTLTPPPPESTRDPRRERGPEVIGALVAFWIAGALLFAPWLIRNCVWTGNPVFPEATTVFGKAHWTDTQVERWERANHLPRPEQQNLAGRLRAAWDQILADPRYAFVALPLGVFAILLRRDPEAVCLGALLLFQAIFWLFFTHLQSRFFVLSIPISALLFGPLLDRINPWLSAPLAVIVVAIGTTVLTLKINALETHFAGYQIPLFGVAGVGSLHDLSYLPVNDDGRSYELVGDGQAFLYDIPMKRLYYRTVFDVDAQPGESAEQAWRKGWPPDGPGVYVIRNDPELERFHRTYFGIP